MPPLLAFTFTALIHCVLKDNAQIFLLFKSQINCPKFDSVICFLKMKFYTLATAFAVAALVLPAAITDGAAVTNRNNIPACQPECLQWWSDAACNWHEEECTGGTEWWTDEDACGGRWYESNLYDDYFYIPPYNLQSWIEGCVEN